MVIIANHEDHVLDLYCVVGTQQRGNRREFNEAYGYKDGVRLRGMVKYPRVGKSAKP